MKGETVLVLNSILLTALLIMSILCLNKLKKNTKEKYTVDISGGFKNLSCGCEGDCILNFRDNPVDT